MESPYTAWAEDTPVGVSHFPDGPKNTTGAENPPSKEYRINYPKSGRFFPGTRELSAMHKMFGRRGVPFKGTVFCHTITEVRRKGPSRNLYKAMCDFPRARILSDMQIILISRIIKTSTYHIY